MTPEDAELLLLSLPLQDILATDVALDIRAVARQCSPELLQQYLHCILSVETTRQAEKTRLNRAVKHVRKVLTHYYMKKPDGSFGVQKVSTLRIRAGKRLSRAHGQTDKYWQAYTYALSACEHLYNAVDPHARAVQRNANMQDGFRLLGLALQEVVPRKHRGEDLLLAMLDAK